MLFVEGQRDGAQLCPFLGLMIHVCLELVRQTPSANSESYGGYELTVEGMSPLDDRWICVIR